MSDFEVIQMNIPNGDNYDRMNPNPALLIQRLIKYANITYGTNAYALSVAEATTILMMLKTSFKINDALAAAVDPTLGKDIPK